MNDKIKWACPRCGTDYEGKHASEQESERCISRGGACQFVCECDGDTDESHGDTVADRCLNAICYHCDWAGEFPPIPWKKKDLPTWAKKALDEGWAPPDGWEPPPKKKR